MINPLVVRLLLIITSLAQSFVICAADSNHLENLQVDCEEYATSLASAKVGEEVQASAAVPHMQEAEYININWATAEELTKVKGIGPAIAKAIVEYRNEHGPFLSVDDLVKVKRIGPKLLEKIRPSASVKISTDEKPIETLSDTGGAHRYAEEESAGQFVNINLATAEELTKVKGIGPAIATAIVEYRNEHGPFLSVDDLVKVKRIGPKLLEKIRPSASVKIGTDEEPVETLSDAGGAHRYAEEEGTDQFVNINLATAEELTKVKGIGLAIATAIVEYRNEHGPFLSVDDLVKVKRIGPKLLEKIRPSASVKVSTDEKPVETLSDAGGAHRYAEEEGTDQFVNINLATAEELTKIKGIGPAIAKAIVEYRNEHGPFLSVDDLIKVKRIGQKSLEKIRARLIAAPAQ